MVMSILEAHVAQRNWAALKQAYDQGAQHREAGVLQSFLVQSINYAELWRIITIWSSREALDETRKAGRVQPGVQIFRSAHAEPILMVFEIAQHVAAQ